MYKYYTYIILLKYEFYCVVYKMKKIVFNFTRKAIVLVKNHIRRSIGVYYTLVRFL